MKSKELIRILQKQDPSGETEVCIGNADVDCIVAMPAYWDGCLQVLQRDEEGNIIGAKYKTQGEKIQIYPYPISEAINGHRQLTVDYSELSPEKAEATKKAHNDLEEWHIRLHIELEFNNFMEWVKSKLKVEEDMECIVASSKSFFDKHISPKDPIKIPLGQSYVSTRKLQWEQKYQVDFIDGFFKIKEK